MKCPLCGNETKGTPRTTGKFSQCTHFNGHCMQIAISTGNDFNNVKWEIKRRAMKRGYPSFTDKTGYQVPISESKASTKDAVHLIDEAHEVAAFLNITLKETE